MATIGPVTLTIVSEDSDTSQVTVRYDIRFNPLDVLANLRYRDRVRLFGDDPVFDDDLIELRNDLARPDGQQTRNRDFTRTVANSTLDEDSPLQRDEIFARVNLRSVDVPFPDAPPRDSNVVRRSS